MHGSLLVTQESNMAAAPLTKNMRRNEQVTFLEPEFMTFELAMLMKQGVSEHVKSFDDINKEGQTKYTFGVVEGGSTKIYFDRSPYFYIETGLTKQTMVENIKEGVKRVRQSTESHPYIFIGEQQTLEYHASQAPCELTVVKGNTTAKEGYQDPPSEYHLAVEKNFDSTIVNKLQAALVKLNETGKLDQLYDKWWKEGCEETSGSSSTVTTSMAAILVPILFAVLSRLSGQ